MSGLVQQILRSLEKGNAVALHGSSGVGKSETMKLLKYSLKEEGKRTVYIDMRHVKNSLQFREEIAKQLEIQNNPKRKIYSELEKGDISLLLDEYWAGSALAEPIVKLAYKFGNDIVTVAGNPLGIKHDEYILQPRYILTL